MKQIKPLEALKEEAFEYYFCLGRERTLEKVGKRFKRKVGTVRNWSYEGKWSERIKIRENEISQKLRQESTDYIVAEKARLIELLKTTLAKATEDIVKGELKIKNQKELLETIKTILELYGEPSQQALKVNVVFTNKVEDFDAD